MNILAFFNNKGGVGKTTLLYHLAWMFADMGKRVVVADFDPQANLTFYRIIRHAAEKSDADLVLMDVGPNFGAINRAALICADAVVIPVAPDLFSIQGLRNLGPTLATWRRDWKTRLGQNPARDLPLPEATMRPLGYVVLQFGIRDSRPVSAYDKWARRIPSTFREKVLALAPDGVDTTPDDPNCLGLLKHYRSLMPMAMEARKPIFKLKPSDGAIGAHTYSVRDCGEDFRGLADRILEALQLPKPATNVLIQP